MGFSLEYSDLEKQMNAVVKAEYGFHDFMKNFLLEMAERILARTKPRTPVDTGTLRDSWELGHVYGWGKTLEVEILNGMDYATEIEYGHRIVAGGIEIGWYEGRFMLKISIDEIRKQMPLRWKKEFKQFCIDKGLEFDN